MALSNFGYIFNGYAASDVIAPPLRKCDFQLEIRTDYPEIGDLKDLPMSGFTIPQFGLSFKPSSDMMNFTTSSVLMNECMFELYTTTGDVSKIISLIRKQYKGGMLDIAYKRPTLLVKVKKEFINHPEYNNPSSFKESLKDSNAFIYSNFQDPLIGFPEAALVNTATTFGKKGTSDIIASADQVRNVKYEPFMEEADLENNGIANTVIMELCRCIFDSYTVENDSSSYDFSTIKFVANYLSVIEHPWLEKIKI